VTLNTADAVEAIKRLILDDIAEGIVSPTVVKFVDLHETVDANGYVLEIRPRRDGEDYDAYIAEINAIENAVDRWLSAGRPSDANALTLDDFSDLYQLVEVALHGARVEDEARPNAEALLTKLGAIINPTHMTRMGNVQTYTHLREYYRLSETDATRTVFTAIRDGDTEIPGTGGGAAVTYDTRGGFTFHVS
jgi:hypothetical protein